MTSLQFSSAWPAWLWLMVAVLGGLAIARWYWRESRFARRPLHWLLPVLRGLAFFLILFMLSGPSLSHRWIDGELSRISVILDLSSSMSMPSDVASEQSRNQKSLEWLLGKGDPKDGWLDRMRSYHRVQWRSAKGSSDRSQDSLLWDSLADSSLPDASSLVADSHRTALGDSLRKSLQKDLDPNAASTPEAERPQEAPAAIVILTDGQSNAGISLGDATAIVASQKVPVFAIGVGSTSEPDDLAILTVDHSQRVYRTDRIRGTMTLKERLPVDTPYRVDVHHLDRIVWSEELLSTDQSTRSIEFDIPAELLVDSAKAQMDASLDYHSVPIDLEFAVECDRPEITLTNNQMKSSLEGMDRKNRIWLIDPQGGWEPRYIKNAMQRDIAWEATAYTGPEAFRNDFFPTTRTQLFEQDVVVATLRALHRLTPDQQQWLSDFVAISGGGLIVIDTKHAPEEPNLLESVAEGLKPFMPVRAVAANGIESLQSMRLTSAGGLQRAFQISQADTPNATIWSQLQAPRRWQSIALEPGAETLVEGVVENESESIPLVASKLFGQGRVLYMAFDESWRWRYGVADRYHQRFWNQLASWTMRLPFAVNDAFASLDSGSRLYSNDETIRIRARLRQEDLTPLEQANVQAILLRDGERFAAVPLAEDAEAHGFYQADAGPLPEGKYSVQLEVVGLPNDALRLSTEFIVRQPPDPEMETLACNVAGLRQLATETGGEFVMLSDAESITDHLKPYQTGKVIETQTVLWQSYPWFASIVGLLAIEWYLRKRAGLV